MLTTTLTLALLAGSVEIINEDAKIIPAEMDQYGGFGSQIVISGDIAVIGANGNDAFGLDAGAAWVLQRDDDGEWVQTQFFCGDDTGFLDEFGYALALHDDLLVVGARFKMVDGMVSAGAAYVFELQEDGQFMQTQMLTAPEAALDASFGGAVDTDGERIVVGARYGDEGAGGAWVFSRDGNGDWALEAELVGSGIDAGDRFGRTVSVHGDRIVCGAPWYAAGCGGTNQCGSVFVFEHDGSDWMQTDRLVPDDLANEDYFGFVVDLGEDNLLVTSVYDDDMGTQSGSGYVFKYDQGSWMQHAKLVAPDGDTQDLMGMCGTLDGDRVVLGGWYGNDSRGAAWIWERSGDDWDFLAEAQASDGQGYDIFGRAVALEDDTLLVGADWADVNGVADAGAVYVFDLDMADAEGACCTNGICATSTESMCDYFGGVFQGDGSDCDDSDCGACSADIDHDGAVTVDDLLTVISQFGPCP